MPSSTSVRPSSSTAAGMASIPATTTTKAINKKLKFSRACETLKRHLDELYWGKEAHDMLLKAMDGCDETSTEQQQAKDKSTTATLDEPVKTIQGPRFPCTCDPETTSPADPCAADVGLDALTAAEMAAREAEYDSMVKGPLDEVDMVRRRRQLYLRCRHRYATRKWRRGKRVFTC